MLLWNQIDRFESTRLTEYGGLSLRVVAEVVSTHPKASVRVFASSPDGTEIELETHRGWESLDEALEAGQHSATMYADAINRSA